MKISSAKFIFVNCLANGIPLSAIKESEREGILFRISDAITSSPLDIWAVEVGNEIQALTEEGERLLKIKVQEDRIMFFHGDAKDTALKALVCALVLHSCFLEATTEEDQKDPDSAKESVSIDDFDFI